MNIVKLQNDLKDLSDQQLLRTMQTGASPQYLVLAEMQRRKKMRDEAATQAPQNEGTVADEIMGGITQLPMQAPQMASGGLVSFASGGYAKGEAEACWTNPETGEKMCPPGKPDIRKPTVKKMQEGGVLRLLPADPVADAYTYLQSRGAEVPADMSEQGIIEYANRVRALDENEVKDAGVNVPAEAAPAARPSWPALFRDYGSGGRGEVMPETQLDTAPQMPMDGGEMAPGFSPVAPTQEGLPGLLAPEGPAPERAVPFLGQMMENIVPSAQAAEDMPSAQAGLSADEARQIMKENAPSWYDVGGRSDVQVIGDAMKLLSGGTGTRWEEEAEKERIAKRDAEKGGVGDAISNMFGRYIQPNPFLEASGVAPIIAGQTVINAASGVKSDVPPSEPTTPATTTPPAQTTTEPPKAPPELPELPEDKGEKELTGREAYFDYLLKRRKGLEGREKDAANQALMAMGLSMMASKNPDFLGALGEGGIKGLEQYGKAQKEREEQILDLLKEEGDIYAAEAMYGTRQGQLGVSAFDKAAKILESKYSGLGRAQTRAALKSKYPNATPAQLEKAIDAQYMREVEALAARMQGTGMGVGATPTLEGAKFLGFE